MKYLLSELITVIVIAALTGVVIQLVVWLGAP